MDNEEYLFVYGTLRSQMNDPLHRLLEKDAILVGTGSFQGRLYDLGRYPGVVPSRGKTDRVLGEIYRFREFKRAFEILDEYEGHRFKRRRVTIFQEDGRSIDFLDLPLRALRKASPAHSIGRLHPVSKLVLTSLLSQKPRAKRSLARWWKFPFAVIENTKVTEEI